MNANNGAPSCPQFPSRERLSSFARTFLDTEDLFERISDRLQHSDPPELAPTRCALEAAQGALGQQLDDLAVEAERMNLGPRLRRRA